ncbi:MAG: J domain-containing protein [Chloroflexota bacterium]
MTWQYEADRERLKKLRQTATTVRRQLIDAETALAEKMGEIRQLEGILERQLGHLFDRLEKIEAELADYYDQIQQRRNASVFGADYRSVDEQYRRVWQKPEQEDVPEPVETAVSLTPAEMKKLYRQLARQYHPDLAADETERAARTAKMTAVNEAYAARSGTDLLALADEAGNLADRFTPETPDTVREMARALEAEISRCRLRIQEIKGEIAQFHNRPIVQMGLEMKLARRQGRDVLTEMRAKLKRKIAQKTAERDMIKAQFSHIQK